MKEILPWTVFLENCRGLPTETLKTFTKNCIKPILKLKLYDDTLMNELYMSMSYLLLERFGEEETSMELQLFTPVYSGQESQERKDTMDTMNMDTMNMKYDCYDFDIEKAFGVSFVFVSSDWERFLNSFTDDYQKYPPRIAPNPGLNKLGLYYFDKDVAVLVTPAGIYSYRGASLTLRGPAYLPLSYFFEMWGE